MARKRKIPVGDAPSFDIEAYKAKIKAYLKTHPDDDLAREEWDLLSKIQESRSELDSEV